MKKCIFSIGPVQGFIAEARRTRDLWSGSFLLSYLSECAMKGVQNAGGTIINPKINDKLCTNNKDLVGGIPNQFTVECNDEKVSAIIDGFKNEFNNAWDNISGKIWDEYLAKYEQKGKGTKNIWDRQVKNYWELLWVVVDGNTNLEYIALKSRKNWRWSEKPPEGGDHCTLMSDYQELSGYTKFKDGEKQKEFWKAIRNDINIKSLDLEEDERLCAIAFIKRFFPNIAKKIINFNNNVDTEHWPSTLYLAAIPWIKKISDKNPKESEEYYTNAVNFYEQAKREGMLDKLGINDSSNIYKLDGNFFYVDSLKNKNATPSLNESARNKLVSQLKKLQEKCMPKPYFAMLLMDGDKMGELKGRYHDKMSECLSNFNNNVPNILKIYNGLTIYAGGDDVLAMLPSNNAIECAIDIYKEFKEDFKEIDLNDNDAKISISAGLTISHYHYPLMSIYKESKRLLEEVAKEKNGRDSIAVSVIKPSGTYLEYVSKWDKLIKNDAFNDAIKNSQYISNSALYSIRDVLSSISDEYISEKNTVRLPKKLENETEKTDIKEIVEKILISKMLSDRKIKDKEEIHTNKRKEEYARKVIEICNYNENDQMLQLDGMFLAKFISQLKEVYK